MRYCKIANQSSDCFVSAKQKAKLFELVGDLMNKSEDHPNMVEIPVTLESLKQSLETLPEEFDLTVEIPHNVEPPMELVTRFLEKPSLDAVTSALIEQYNMENSIMCVVDLSTLPETRWVLDSADQLKKNTESLDRIMVLHTGTLKNWNLTSDSWTVDTLELNSEMISRLASNCQSHIISCETGYLNALLSKSESCVYPNPWIPGSSISAQDSWISRPYQWAKTKYFDQAYYINLDHRKDRLEHMETQMQRFGIRSARIQAVDGKKHITKWNPEYGVLSKFWNHGAFATCLSHRMAIVNAMQQGYENILVMEDDCILQDNLWEVLDKAWNDLPDEWHMLYLGANHGCPTPVAMPTEQDRKGDYLYRMKGSMGAHAIIINKMCFPVILNFLTAPYAPIDSFYANYQRFFPCYITYPGLASQLPGKSDIINTEVNYTKDWGIDYINHIASRKTIAFDESLLTGSIPAKNDKPKYVLTKELNPEDLGIYIIHYTPLVKRKELQLKQLDDLFLSNYMFVEKHDRENLETKDLDKFKSDGQLNRIQHLSSGQSDYRLNLATISLFIKHMNAVELIQNSKFNFNLVIEDDTILDKDFIKKLESGLKQLPDDYDMVFIGPCCGLHIEDSVITPDKLIYKKCREATHGCHGATRGTGAILINKKCCKGIYDFYKKDNEIREPIDHWYNDMIRKLKLNVYWIEPVIVTHGSESGMFKSSLVIS